MLLSHHYYKCEFITLCGIRTCYHCILWEFFITRVTILHTLHTAAIQQYSFSDELSMWLNQTHK